MSKTALTQEDCHRIIRDLNRDAPRGTFRRPLDHIVIDFNIMPVGVKVGEAVNSSQGGRRPGVVPGTTAGSVLVEQRCSEVDKSRGRQQEETDMAES